MSTATDAIKLQYVYDREEEERNVTFVDVVKELI